MKGYFGWSYQPYVPLNCKERENAPYIAALRPGRDFCEVEWVDPVNLQGPHTAVIEQEGGILRRQPLEGGRVLLADLTPGETYTVTIEDDGDHSRRSDRRLVTPGDIIGRPVNYLHPEDTAYWYSGNSLCSPAIVKLDSGRLLVSMDIYRPRYGQNLTKIFFSDDGGESWSFLTDLFPCFWGKLFVHRNALYMLAMTTEYGDVLIGRSEDGGRTWPRFVNLFPGSGNRDCGGPHKAPMNIFSHNGRLWTAVDYGTWERGGHATGVLSVGEDDDLLDPASWTLTPFLPFDDNWPGAAQGKSRGCLEGNMVLLPDGKLVNFLRYQIQMCTPNHDKAALFAVDTEHPEAPLTLYKIIDFIGGISKFSICRDAQSGYYLALVNRVADPSLPMSRDVLSLTKSRDGEHWELVSDLMYYHNGQESGQKVGVQYPDMIIDGDDMLWVQRTAMNNARNFHDSNYITFHRLENFRSMLG